MMVLRKKTEKNFFFIFSSLMAKDENLCKKIPLVYLIFISKILKCN